MNSEFYVRIMLSDFCKLQYKNASDNTRTLVWHCEDVDGIPIFLFRSKSLKHSIKGLCAYLAFSEFGLTDKSFTVVYFQVPPSIQNYSRGPKCTPLKGVWHPITFNGFVPTSFVNEKKLAVNEASITVYFKIWCFPISTSQIQVLRRKEVTIFTVCIKHFRT